jgi:competence protein ComEC
LRAARGRVAVRSGSAPARRSASCSGHRSRCSLCSGCRAGGVRGDRVRAAVAAGAAGLAALPRAQLPPPTGLRITFLDVGQGDAILLQVPRARCSSTRAARGERRAAASRPRRPATGRGRAHASAARPHRWAEDVLRGSAVDRVLDPALAVSGPDERAALAGARAAASRSSRRGRRRLQARRLRLRVLWPTGRARRRGPEPCAIVLLASYGEVDALLTADAETDVTARLLSTRVEILKVRTTAPPTRSRERAARAAAGGRRDLLWPRQRLRPSDAVDARSAAGQPGPQPLPDGRGRAVVVESDGGGSRSGRAVE